jgi:hypothetical protein
MHFKALALVGMLLLAACSSNKLNIKETPEGNQSVASLDEAGSVHVAVLAVTPWDEVKAKLRPNLKIDDKDLRNQAIPVTFSLLDKYLDILRFQASIALATVKTTQTSTSTTETGKDDVSKTESTTTKAPGEARATPGAAALAAGSSPAIAASGVSAINSSLTARAMASFVQDVAALNAEVDSAAKRTGYEPYLMRVQVTVMPRRRHLGYDVYSNLSFFGYSGVFDQQTGSAGPRTATDGTPFVVPLLSSDSIETAQRAQSIEALRDVGVALDLVKGFGAAGFSANSQKDRQQALQGLDVNSVLTMGRLTDNTLRVRFGAAFDPGGGFAVHPRTNTISILVFFPKNAVQTRVVSRTSWSHVLDGTILEHSQERYDARLEPIATQWGDLGLTVARLKEIDELPFEGNYLAFKNAMDSTLNSYCAPTEPPPDFKLPKKCTEPGPKHELWNPGRDEERERSYAYVWSHILSILPGGRFSTTIVDLPKLASVCPVASQLTAYIEDEKGITVALRGGEELASAKLRGALHWAFLEEPAPAADANPPGGSAGSGPKVAAAGGKGPAKPVLKGYAGALMASEVAVSDDRTATALAFASDGMQPLSSSTSVGLVPTAVELAGCSVKVVTAVPADSGLTRLLGDGSQLYMLNARVPKKEKADAKEKPSATLSVGTPDLLLYEKRDPETSVTVDLGDKPKTAFALTASGGVLKSVGPSGSVELRRDGSYLVKTSGTLVLTFSNVSANRTVDLELRAIDEKDKLGASASKLSLSARKS